MYDTDGTSSGADPFSQSQMQKSEQNEENGYDRESGTCQTPPKHTHMSSLGSVMTNTTQKLSKNFSSPSLLSSPDNAISGRAIESDQATTAHLWDPVVVFLLLFFFFVSTLNLF